MKCVFVYYSYSGVTKQVVHDLNKIVSGTVIEVTPDKPYNTITAYSLGCLRARNEDVDAVSPDTVDVSEFDHVVVAGPVWAWMPAPPVNGAIRAIKNGNGKSASIISTAGSDAGRTLEVMRAALEKQGLKVTGELSLSKKDIKDKTRIEEFAAALMQESA